MAVLETFLLPQRTMVSNPSLLGEPDFPVTRNCCARLRSGRTYDRGRIDYTDTHGEYAGSTFLAIYTLDGDDFKFCAAGVGATRPTGFRTGLGQVLRVMRREPAGSPGSVVPP